MEIVNKRQLVRYLRSLLFACDEPLDTELTYVYFKYNAEYTHYLRITVKDCTLHTIRIVVSGLLHLEQTQPAIGEGEAYASVLKGLLRCMTMLEVRVIDMRPVRYCEMLECSGIVVTELTNETIPEGNMAPKVEVFSAGHLVFHDHVNWLFVTAKDK